MFLKQALDFPHIFKVHWPPANKAAANEHSGECYLLVKKGYQRETAMVALEGMTIRNRTVRVAMMTDWPSRLEVRGRPSGRASAPTGPHRYTGASVNPGSALGTASAAMLPQSPNVETEIQQALAEIEAQKAVLHAQMKLLNMREAELHRRLGKITASVQPPSRRPPETVSGVKSENGFDPECRPGSHPHNHTYPFAQPAEQKNLESTRVLGEPHSAIGTSHHLTAVPERGTENHREVHPAQLALVPHASCPYEDIWKLDTIHKETAVILEPKIAQPQRAGYPFPDWSLGASSSTKDGPSILIPHLDDRGQDVIVKPELIERETSGKSVFTPDSEPVTLSSQLLHGPPVPTQGADGEEKDD